MCQKNDSNRDNSAGFRNSVLEKLIHKVAQAALTSDRPVAALLNMMIPKPMSTMGKRGIIYFRNVSGGVAFRFRSRRGNNRLCAISVKWNNFFLYLVVLSWVCNKNIF